MVVVQHSSGKVNMIKRKRSKTSGIEMRPHRRDGCKAVGDIFRAFPYNIHMYWKKKSYEIESARRRSAQVHWGNWIRLCYVWIVAWSVHRNVSRNWVAESEFEDLLDTQPEKAFPRIFILNLDWQPSLFQQSPEGAASQWMPAITYFQYGNILKMPAPIHIHSKLLLAISPTN